MLNVFYVVKAAQKWQLLLGDVSVILNWLHNIVLSNLIYMK